ncbi:HET-domain-containing protein [Xylariaceae sp. FL1272]|nr:HET-domain-containing protein [Xylariaceae sp. FL1272]
MANNIFQYTPLEEKSDDIRLVNIIPGEEEDELGLEIFHVPMAQAQTFHRTTNIRSTVGVLEGMEPGWWAGEILEGGLIYYNVLTEVSTYDRPNPRSMPRFRRVQRSLEVRAWKSAQEGKSEFWRFIRNLPAELRTSIDDSRDIADETIQQAPSVPYEALSYTWGSGFARSDYWVNVYPGKNDQKTQRESRGFVISRNVAVMLKFLRHRDKARTVWIDSICIDQSNLDERSVQVRRMGEIYRNASRVVAWLGPSFADAELALSTLEYLGRQVEVTRDSVLIPRPSCEKPEWTKVSFPLPYDKRVWYAIIQLCSNPYFERLWVLQEMQLASSASIVKCGKHEIDWPLFRRAIICIGSRVHLPHDVRMGIRKLTDLCQYCFKPQPEYLLSRYALRKCSDDRDRIYGLLNLLPPSLAALVEVTYSKPTHEVYQQMMLARIQQVQRLDMLKYCDRRSCAHGGNQTWVPDWQYGHGLVPYYLCFQASGVSGVTVQVKDDGVLQVPAIYIGNIQSSLHLRGAGSIYQHSPVARICSILRNLGVQALEDTRYHNGETRLEAWLRALTVGNTKDRRPERASVESFPTLSQLKTAVLSFAESDNTEVKMQSIRMWDRGVLEKIWQLLAFTSAEGYIGTTKADILEGDEIFAILGCDVPMVLRPARSGRDGYYQVMGECFVSGFMDGEAVLGELPVPWCVRGMHDEDNYDIPHYRNKETGKDKMQDPRLGKLPPDWEPFRWTRTRDDPKFCEKFRNKKTGEIMNSYPQLLPDELKKRGVNVQNICLV